MKNFCFLNYCAHDTNGTIEQQVSGAFEVMEDRLALIGLKLENVVQMNCRLKNIWGIPAREKVVKERFNGKYPARKSKYCIIIDNQYIKEYYNVTAKQACIRTKLKQI